MSRALRGKDALRVMLAEKYLEAEQLVADGKWEEKWGDDECLMRTFLENDAIIDDGTYTLYDKIDQLLGFVWVSYDTTSLSLYVIYRRFSIWPVARFFDFDQKEPVRFVK